MVSETETVRIGGVNFDIIPHYEDESKIVEALGKSKNHVIGHFGFDGCISNGHYKYESYVKKKHFKKKLAFLGHIHKPQVYDNVHVLGTQYSTTFGEANAKKMVTELLIHRDGNIEVIRKPIDFGIRHIVGYLDEIDELSRKFEFDKFFSVLRVKIDNLDSFMESKLRDDIFEKYALNHVEIAFEDVLPKFLSDYSPEKQQLTVLNEEVILDYIDASNTIFSKDELLTVLNEIKDEIK